MATLFPTIRKETAKAEKVNFSKVAFPSGVTFTMIEHLPAITKENINGSTSIEGMFMGNPNIKEITFAEGSLDGVKYMTNLARECHSLERIKFPTSMESVNNTSGLLGCYTPNITNKVTHVEVPDLPNANVVYSMFYGCENLESVVMGDIGANMDNIVANFVFNRCINLKTAKLGDLSKVTLPENIKFLFSSCTSLTDLSIKALPAVDMTNGEFSGCPNLTAQSYVNILAALPVASSKTILFANKFNDVFNTNNNTTYTASNGSGSNTFLQWMKTTITNGWTIKTLDGTIYNSTWANAQ